MTPPEPRVVEGIISAAARAVGARNPGARFAFDPNEETWLLVYELVVRLARERGRSGFHRSGGREPEMKTKPL